MDLTHDYDICEREGFPESLSDKHAAELGDARPGAPVVLVLEGEQAEAAVSGAGCLEPQEYVPGATILELTQAAGGVPEGLSGAQMMFLPPYFAFVGVRPHPGAILTPPVPVARGKDEGASQRAAIRSAAKRISAAHTARCSRETGSGETVPATAEAIEAAADRAKAWRIPSPSPTVWVIFEDPAITQWCEPEIEPEVTGVLLDLAAGSAMYEVESNNTVELQWTTDLDGDGTHEALVDVTWLEDGGHEIVLVHQDDEAWANTTLYAADGP